MQSIAAAITNGRLESGAGGWPRRNVCSDYRGCPTRRAFFDEWDSFGEVARNAICARPTDSPRWPLPNWLVLRGFLGLHPLSVLLLLTKRRNLAEPASLVMSSISGSHCYRLPRQKWPHLGRWKRKNSMEIPGFTAEASLSGKSASFATPLQSNSTSRGSIVPALPYGGLAQLACVKAICARSPSQCPTAWKICMMGGQGGFPEWQWGDWGTF